MKPGQTRSAAIANIPIERLRFILPLLFILLLAACAAKAPVPQPPEIPADLRCAICGMRPASTPQWQCQILMGDGRQVAFDSPRELFAYLLLTMRYGYAEKQGLGKGVKEIWVRDFDTTAWLDGRAACYVAGSGRRGVMGPEYIPFGGREAAEAFQRREGGNVFDYDRLVSELRKRETK